MTLRNILTLHGYEVAGEAANGVESVELYKTLMPDAVIMDVAMPKMDGVTALKEIRSFDPNANVVLMAAVPEHLNVAEALKAGAKDFIVKPFQPDRVMAAMAKVLG
ncbi:MAG: response regulator [Fimbriimonas sp.]